MSHGKSAGTLLLVVPATTSYVETGDRVAEGDLLKGHCREHA